jgi:glycosyltransferase involved in cell wall biosynthesis
MGNFFIVVPAWNAAAFLDQTLASLLREDLSGLRVHVHIQDAGSTDATPDIIRAFASTVEASPKREQLTVSHASEADAGMYDAIQRGVERWARRFIKPDVFFWLNADDALMPGVLSRLAATFADPSVQWVIGHGVDIDPNDAVVYHQPHKRIDSSKLRSGDFNYAGGDWLRAESTAVRFSQLEEGIGFTSDLRLAGDYRFFMNLARRAEPTYCDYPIRAFRRHAGQLSKAAIAYQHERSRVRFFESELKGQAQATAVHPIDQRTQIIFFPDYSAGNSYQPLLYSSVQSAGASSLGQLDTLAAANRRAILHLHWLNPITRLEHEEAGREADRLKGIVTRARQAGQKVVFTVHNVASHEGRNLDVEEGLVEFLFATADAVHLHHPVVSVQIQERYKTFPWGRVVIAEHGAYPAEGQLEDKASVLARFGLTDPDLAYCVIPGQIRGYKNIGFQVNLLRRFAVSGVAPKGFKVLIAGEVHPEVERAQGEALKRIPGVHLAPQRLDDAAFTATLRHADFALLCYRDISTSGSLFHALSVSTPVVAPRLGTIPSYLFDGFNGYLYAPADETSCMQAIKRILAGQEAAQLRPGAAKSVAHLQWHLTLAKILQKVAS